LCSAYFSNNICSHQGYESRNTWTTVRKNIIIMGIKEGKKYINDEVDGRPSLTV
jgi:hypothetical protein